MNVFAKHLLRVIPEPMLMGIERRINRARFRRALQVGVSKSPAEYWGAWMVLDDPVWLSLEQSIQSFHERVDQYPGYLDLMPVEGHRNESVLDYGCGPGHDLAGFAEYSSAERIVGVDVSMKAVESAQQRLGLHARAVEIHLIPERDPLRLFAENSFDYVHSSGVLHHVANVDETLGEIRRVLRPQGRARIMIYNRDSIWYHLYAGFVLPHAWRVVPHGTPTDDIFRMSTDGPGCPIAVAFTAESFGLLAADAGFNSKFVGSAMSRHELRVVSEYLDVAQKSRRLEEEHRAFLRDLYFENGVPMHNGKVAGIDLVVELTPIV